MNGCGWIKEQINNLEFTNQTQISDHFREGWKSFSFPQFLLLPGQHERNAFFPLVLLNSTRELAGKQKTGQK